MSRMEDVHLESQNVSRNRNIKLLNSNQMKIKVCYYFPLNLVSTEMIFHIENFPCLKIVSRRSIMDNLILSSKGQR